MAKKSVKKDIKVGLCCIAKMENNYIREFIEHYKNLGVDHVFLYDNNDTDGENFEDVIGDYIENGYIEVIDFKNRKICQLDAYNDCYKNRCNGYDWVCFFDCDEYLMFSDETLDIKTFLSQEKFNNFDMIHINWKVYGDNNLVRYENKSLKERFIIPIEPLDFKCGYNFPENNHIKSIVRGGLPDVKWEMTPHTPNSELNCCKPNGEICDAKSPFSLYNFDYAWLNHYQTKTIEEWVEIKAKRGFPDGNKDFFKTHNVVADFFRRNKRTKEKNDFLKTIDMDEKIIVSMTTIIGRKERLVQNLPSILEQSYKFDKLIINVDDDLSDEDYNFYFGLTKKDNRIEIQKSEKKWRSCNKLLPSIKRYPDDIIITVDDDIYYPVDCIKLLVEEWYKHPDCIITHEINPIYVKENYVGYYNSFDVMLKQREWGKYFSNCCLFPPHCFDGTDLFDYDKMMYCTNGLHDELWFWVNSTIKGIQCIGLNYIYSFSSEIISPYKEDEYQLTNYNKDNNNITNYMDKINEMYGEKLIRNILHKPVLFELNPDNVDLFILLLPKIKKLFNYNCSVSFNNLTKAWQIKLQNELSDKNKNKKYILITGIGGLIGSNFANWIIKNHKEYTVIGVDSLFDGGGYKENIPEGVIFFQRDLSKSKINDVFEAVRKSGGNIEYVYHFAAYAAEGLSPFMRMFNWQNNSVSTANIINCCVEYGVKRLVYTSSMSVYGHGKNDGSRFNENDTPCPIDPYGISKYACEMDIKVAGEQHGLDWCIIRPHNCYSDDTEILTENGWKLFKDISSSERVLTLDTDNMKMEYQTPTEYHKYFIDDYLYNFNTKGIDLFVTADHNMVTRSDGKNKIQKITADEIYNNSSKYYYYETLKNGYEFDTNKNDDIIIPEVKDSFGRSMTNEHQNGGEKIIKAEDWFSFLGWYISEGCCFKTPSNYVVSISQHEDIHKENYENIKSLIDRMGFKYYATKKEIKIHSKQLYSFLKNIFTIPGANNKFIPREYMNYSKSCLLNLFESLMAGDGRSDGSSYVTSSKQLADDFSELLLRIGKCGTISKRQNSNIYDVYIVKNINPSFGDMYTKKINCDKIKYEGYVYDITVPNHIIYVRRNGKSCWGSNCYGERQNIWDKYRNVLGIWMYQILHNEPILVYGDGKQERAFTYIDDMLEPLWNAAVKPQASKEIINLGNIKSYTINEAANILCEITGYNKIEHKESRHEVKHAVPSYEKSIDILGFEDKTSLRDGLKKMWEWAKNQPDKPQYKWENYEINKGLYSYWK